MHRVTRAALSRFFLAIALLITGMMIGYSIDRYKTPLSEWDIKAAEISADGEPEIIPTVGNSNDANGAVPF